MSDRTGRVLSGRYALDEILGRGGMGVVHRATDKLLDRTVAIKLLGADVEESFRQRFLREAKSTARVRHPGVVQVFDFGRTDEGETYLVMELLLGVTLQHHVEAAAPLSFGSRLPAEEIARISTDIASAIAAAHEAGVVHRDLKPANIFLEGAERRVVVIDFGIAKTLSAGTRELTSQGAMIGTVEYMAPEQILGEAVDGRTDVYALGCVMYRMLTRRLPFEAETMPELVHRHLTQPPRPIALVEQGREVPSELAALVHACLAKKSDERPTMAEVRDCLTGGAAPLLSLDGPERAFPGPARSAETVPRSVPIPDLLPRTAREASPTGPAPPTVETTGIRDGAGLEIDERPAAGPAHMTTRVRACPRCGVRLALYARGCHACGHSDDPNFTRVAPPEPARHEPENAALAFVHALPVALHKRLFAGGILVAILNAIFFHGSLAAYGLAAFATAFGGLGLWLHRRR